MADTSHDLDKRRDTSDTPCPAPASEVRLLYVPRRIVLLAVSALLLFVYCPVLIGSYAFFDDYYYLQTFLKGGNSGARLWLYKRYIAFGRVSAIPLAHISFAHLHNISDVRYVRLSSVIAIAAVACLLYRRLTKVGWTDCQSAFVALAVSTMPPFQVLAAWAAAAQYAISAALTGIAYEAFDSGFYRCSGLRRRALLLSAAAIEIISLTINQSAGTYFIVFAAAALFAPTFGFYPRLGHFIRTIGVFFVCLCVAFAVDRVGVRLYGPLMGLDAARTAISLDVWGKLSWFIRFPLMNALNLCHFPSTSRVAMAIALFIAIGLPAYFTEIGGGQIISFVVALVLLVFGYLPNLVAAESWPSYRTQGTLSSLIVLYGFFALRGLLARAGKTDLLGLVLGAFAFTCCLLASLNVLTYFVIPQSIELAVARYQVRQIDLSTAHTLQLRCSRATDSVAPVVTYDEFGFPSSANWGDFGPEVALLLRERGVDYRGLVIEFVRERDDTLVEPRNGIAVIDMHELANYRRRPPLVLPPVGELPYP